MPEFIERAKFSCALGGALTTITGLPKVIPIVHASGGCAAALSGTYNIASGYRGTGYCGGTMIPTTNISESNIVFGGEDRLEEQIEHTLEVLDGDLYVVVTGCQVEIIGDDASNVARRFEKRKVIAANTAGFIGNTFKGYDAVLKAIITDVIKGYEIKEKKTVNLLGIVPGHDVFYRGNLEELKRLLGLIGIKANTFFGTGENIDSIKEYGKATYTFVFSKQAGVESAETFLEVHKIPYEFFDIPIGPTATEEFLRKVGDIFEIDSKVIEEIIQKERKEYYSFFERIVDIYSDLDFQRYVIVAADSYYAYSLTRFLADDLGWIPYLTAVNDIDEEEERKDYLEKFERISSEIKPKVIFEEHAGAILKEFRKIWPENSNEKYNDAFSPSFVVGSGIEKGLAEKLGAGFLAVAFPVSNRVVLNKGYTGFKGGLSLVEDLLSQLVATR